jgi:cytochrome b subunit of formate dehydrogenase
LSINCAFVGSLHKIIIDARYECQKCLVHVVSGPILFLNFLVHVFTFVVPVTIQNSIMQMVLEFVTESLIDDSYARWQLSGYSEAVKRCQIFGRYLQRLSVSAISIYLMTMPLSPVTWICVVINNQNSGIR